MEPINEKKYRQSRMIQNAEKPRTIIEIAVDNTTSSVAKPDRTARIPDVRPIRFSTLGPICVRGRPLNCKLLRILRRTRLSILPTRDNGF